MSEGDGRKPYSGSLRAWAARALERGREAWPELAVSEEELTHAAALRLKFVDDASPEALDAAELYLASACARGDRVALVQFRRSYFDPLAPALLRMGLTDAPRDDVWQKLCERLFISADGDLPRIVRYAGTGDLARLVKVAATRVALNWVGQEKRRVGGDDWLLGLPADASDPEMHAMKRQHRVELKRALEAAVAGLEPRARMVLRLHLVERLGIDAIASVCAVHRATAARLVARAKEDLAARVRARLVARWDVAEASLPPLKTLLDSQLELSLERLLADD